MNCIYKKMTLFLLIFIISIPMVATAAQIVGLSSDEIAVYGTNACGWTDLDVFYKDKYKYKVYGYGAFGEKDSIYKIDNLKYAYNLGNCNYNNSCSIEKESKASIVDILQININRYYNEQPLIPIQFILSSTFISNEFTSRTIEQPNLKDVINHKGGITGAELRMVYKLSEEVGDEVIKLIMRRSVQFIHLDIMIDYDYNSREMNYNIQKIHYIDSPWSNPVQSAQWKSRVRHNGIEKYQLMNAGWLAALKDFRKNQAVVSELFIIKPRY